MSQSEINPTMKLVLYKDYVECEDFITREYGKERDGSEEDWHDPTDDEFSVDGFPRELYLQLRKAEEEVWRLQEEIVTKFKELGGLV